LKRLVVTLLICAVAACADGRGTDSAIARSGATVQDVGPNSSFARRIERLSEPGGYFDTDNLISNETSYLHVVGALEELEVRGGRRFGRRLPSSSTSGATIWSSISCSKRSSRWHAIGWSISASYTGDRFQMI
jgi:hypothetical protein